MSGTTTCGFCGTRFGAAVKACPKCSYPADGAFDGSTADGEQPKGAAKLLSLAKARRRKRKPPPETCANCGDTFPAGRPACPHCGADAQTGWKSAADLDETAATLPEFDEDDYRSVVNDLTPGNAAFWSSRQARLMIIGIVLVLAMIVPALIALRFVRLP